MLKIKKPLIAAVSMALGLGMAAGAQAAAELFDTHSSDGVLNITGFDWSPTTFLAQGGQTAIANFVGTGGACVTASCTFNAITQASAVSFAGLNGLPIPGTRINADYEITMFAIFQEKVTSVTGGPTTANFAVVTGTPITVELYYSSTVNANPLTGFGYNDGNLILKATAVQDATGSFTVSSATPVAIDQFTADGDQYPGQSTVTGSGDNTNIAVGSITQDFAFFKNLISVFGLNFTNVGQDLPFKSIDPMDCLTQTAKNLVVGTSNTAYACDNTHVVGTYAAQGPAADAFGYVPVVGATNGLFAGTNPDFVAQTDFNSTLSAVIPEPASLALVGLGLGVLGFGAARRRHSKAA